MRIPRFGIIPASLFIIASLLHISVQRNLVSLLPLPILLSTLVVWLLPAPGYYLLGIAVIGEVWGSLPPGIMTLIVITPLLFFHLRRQVPIDISFSFALILTATAALQLLFLALAQLWPTIVPAAAWPGALINLPWPMLALMLVLNTIASWGLCIIIDSLAPRRVQTSSPFDYHRYGHTHHR